MENVSPNRRRLLKRRSSSSSESSPVQLLVKSTHGLLTVHTSRKATVLDIQEQISQQTPGAPPPAEMRLLMGSYVMHEGTLRENGVNKDSVLTVTGRLCGGAPKRAGPSDAELEPKRRRICSGHTAPEGETASNASELPDIEGLLGDPDPVLPGDSEGPLDLLTSLTKTKGFEESGSISSGSAFGFNDPITTDSTSAAASTFTPAPLADDICLDEPIGSEGLTPPPLEKSLSSESLIERRRLSFSGKPVTTSQSASSSSGSSSCAGVATTTPVPTPAVHEITDPRLLGNTTGFPNDWSARLVWISGKASAKTLSCTAPSSMRMLVNDMKQLVVDKLNPQLSNLANATSDTWDENDYQNLKQWDRVVETLGQLERFSTQGPEALQFQNYHVQLARASVRRHMIADVV